MHKMIYMTLDPLKETGSATQLQNPQQDTQIWYNLPDAQIPAQFMYATGTPGVSARIGSYRLNKTQLLTLLTGNPDRLRFHLAAISPQIPSRPGFTLIAQAYDSTKGDPGWNNAIYMQPDTYSASNSVISPELAMQMNEAWMSLSDQQVAASVNSDIYGRLKSYCFLASDVTTLINYTTTFASDPLSMTVYLGAYAPSAGHPYIFRVIMMISNGRSEKSDVFFEFSSPCPPAC